MGTDALHVIGLFGPGDKISLFLKDCELAKVALSCRVALDMRCREMHEAWQLGRRCQEAHCHSKKSLALTVDGLRQRKERDVVREK